MLTLIIGEQATVWHTTAVLVTGLNRAPVVSDENNTNDQSQINVIDFQQLISIMFHKCS